MSKIPMVTRTVHRNVVTVLCLDVNKAEPFTKTVYLSAGLKKEKDMLKAAKKLIDTDEVKAVHVVDVEKSTGRYGMTEEEFMLYARPLTEAENDDASAEADDEIDENN